MNITKPFGRGYVDNWSQPKSGKFYIYYFSVVNNIDIIANYSIVDNYVYTNTEFKRGYITIINL